MVKKVDDVGQVKPDPGLGAGQVPDFGFPEPIPEPEQKEEKPEAVVVDPEVAGDLLRIPFDLVNTFWPDFDPLTDTEVNKVKVVFSRCLIKWGMAKITRDEMILAFYLSQFVVSRVNRARRKSKVKANEKLSFFGGGKEGDRKDDFMSGPDKKI